MQALSHWLSSGGAPFSLDLANWAPASSDASFRRYFRIGSHDPAHPSLIVMDAPPPQEDCHPFVHVAGLLDEAGLQAPKVLAADLSQGFLLLTDLGRETYLDVLTDDNARPLMRAALDALIVWQKSSRPNVLPAYDTALLQRELDLFPDWYVDRHLKVDLSETQRATLERTNQLLIESALAQPKVFVHRDYMPRNLMPGLPGTPGPGILDFQDAVYGPLTYDVISLMRDAFLSWDEARQLDWLAYYWERARKAGLPVDADFGEFYRQAEWMGLQRHLKVLGIFARINYRDGKPRYLADTPRFIEYARKVADRYAPLRPLAKLLDELTGQQVDVGYTF
ncbi:aminoglycoside phosphotransferase [Pandoraea faecigallinarum]|uniref:Aminoglycoside phosphotransferase n=1 Tax=Pandoraea faecigallinarum TaxID=656179 RepID=A0A0H3WYF6_9BURK|nr:aminoglycoside phosphotransferase [Pandoraea faecigallinarum]